MKMTAMLDVLIGMQSEYQIKHGREPEFVEMFEDEVKELMSELPPVCVCTGSKLPEEGIVLGMRIIARKRRMGHTITVWGDE